MEGNKVFQSLQSFLFRNVGEAEEPKSSESRYHHEYQVGIVANCSLDSGLRLTTLRVLPPTVFLYNAQRREGIYLNPQGVSDLKFLSFKLDKNSTRQIVHQS